MNEGNVQNLLFRELTSSGHMFITPNTCALGHEADLISVTPAEFVYEYEIKLSRSDFLADKQKVQKHYFFNLVFLSPNKKRGYYEHIPNRFFYVTPEYMVKEEEVPAYAGLMYFHQGCVWTVKQAPQIHAFSASFGIYRRLATSLMWKVFSGITKRPEMVRTKWGEENG